MKKFKKSVVAISLACLLVLNLTGGVVLAGGGFGEGEFYEMHVNLNGETLAVANYYSNYGPYIQYASVMRALGYEVTYDGETNSVIADNGNIRTVVFLEEDENGYTKIWVTKDGEQKEYYNYKYALEINGTAYVGYGYGEWSMNYDWHDLWEDTYGLMVRFGAENIDYFIDVAALKADTRAKLAHLANIPSYSALVPNYTSNASGTVSFNLNSSLFGIDIKGESGLTMATAKNGDKMMLDFNMDNGGNLNLYSLFCGPYTLGLDYYKDKIDLSQPVSAQAIFDGNDLYGKGDFLVENIALSNLGSEYNYLDEDYREIAAEKIDGRWVKAWLNEWQRKAAIEQVLEAVNSNQIDIDELAESIVNSALSDYRYYYYDDDGIYNKIIQKIDAIVGLIGPDAIKCVEANGEKVITYRLTTEALKRFKEAYTDTVGNTIYDEMELNLESKTTIFADNTAKSTITGMFKINNIPNEYNIPFGSMEIKLDMNEESVPQASEISAPAEYVEFEQLYNESLPYRRQYQGL